MKLKDYLKQFEGMDPEAEVLHTIDVGCCGDNDMLEEPTIDNHKFEFKKEKHSYVRIMYPAHEYLNSCRKYGAAKDRNG